MPKPRPDHPWILRTRKQVARCRNKKRRQLDSTALALAEQREDELEDDPTEVERAIRDFFQ